MFLCYLIRDSAAMTHIYMLLERVTKNGEIMNRLIDSVHYSIRIGMADGQSVMDDRVWRKKNCNKQGLQVAIELNENSKNAEGDPLKRRQTLVSVNERFFQNKLLQLIRDSLIANIECNSNLIHFQRKLVVEPMLQLVMEDCQPAPVVI